MRAIVLSVTLAAFVFACSSTTTSPSTGTGTDGGPSGCSCDVTFNGVEQAIDCSAQACVNGVTFTCDATAHSSMGGNCTAASSDGGGTGNDSGGGQDSSTAATTVPCAYHDFTANKDVTTCDAATQYCIRSYQQALGPGSNNVCVPLPASCSACPCASDNAEAAWKKATNNTANCSNVTLTCSGANGAIIVDCVQ
jgi:hypothetical protein